jgi:hypothetical protein
MDHPNKTSIIPAITRREFLEGTGKAALALTAVRAEGAEGAQQESAPDALAEAFRNPPEWARSWVYWWWLNGDVSREGIIRDLDEMKRQGIVGVLVFNAGGGPTPKTTVFMSEEWRDLFRFAVQEAAQRGIEVSLNLCSGWNAGGTWITAEEAPQTLVFTSLRAHGPQALAEVLPEPKHDDPYYEDVAVLAYQQEFAEGSPHPVYRPDSMQDLTGSMERNGRLTWQVPEGDWLILRCGHTVLMPLGRARIKESGPKDKGYEIDPLRAEAMDKHFAATAGKVLADCQPWVGKSLKYLHIDSWEIAKPNWTANLRGEFQRRRGYDLWPYLPAVAGEVVDSPKVAARFKEDFDATLSDLTVENYYGRFAELAHQHGVGIHPESEGYQKSCVDSLTALGRSDIMMGEYWSREASPEGYIHQLSAAQLRWHDSIKEAASAAHIYGRPIAQGEAFTCLGAVDWSEFPFALKDIGDRAFCAGLNRNVLNYYVHQPDAEAIPGNHWPGCGLKIDRFVTWWPMSHAWLRYLTRCQYLFRRGRFVADVCYFYGEGAPNYVPARDSMIPPLPAGFDCDSINAEALLSRMTVQDGRVCLPGGFSYRLLVMPYRPWSMPPESIFLTAQNAFPGQGIGLPVGISTKVLQRIKELVQDGATILGPKPVRSPGLNSYAGSDEEVKNLADELWGEAAGDGSGERRVGKGRVIWGKRIEDILSGDNVLPDFRFRSDQWATDLPYIHYTLDGAEIYFVSNQSLRPEKVECRFRVGALQPELWDAVTGEIRDLPDFRHEQGEAIVPMEFAPRQSFFVVFRRAAPPPSGKARENFPRMEVLRAISGSWEVLFDPKWGGPEKAIFGKLADWTGHPEEGIRYYSGAATYRKSFDAPENRDGRRIFLDLGVVNYLAAVRLNGNDLGVVWTAPWQVEITQALKPGGNSLEIDVVNLWTNRLIGDAALPPEKRFTKTNVVPKPDWPLLPSGLLGPVTLRRI